MKRVYYKKLFEKMTEKGIKKTDLRTRYGINPKTIVSLVNNQSVSVETIIKLCEVLDCQPGQLMEAVEVSDGEELPAADPSAYSTVVIAEETASDGQKKIKRERIYKTK